MPVDTAHTPARESPAEPVRFRLFIAGASPRSQRAVGTVRELAAELGDACDVDIVDVVADPALAEAERILATPALIKESPPPRRRMTGDLSDIERVLAVFGLSRTARSEHGTPYETEQRSTT